MHLHEKVRDYLAGERSAFPTPRQLRWYKNLVGEGPFDWTAAREFATTVSDEGMDTSGRFKLSCPVHGFLEDGRRVPGACDWQVIHTPGHTECSICFWNEKTGTLLSGDAVLSVKGKGWINPVHAVPEKMPATEEKLRKLPVQHLLPGHGAPVTGPRVMAEALSFRERVAGATPNTCALKRLFKR